MNAARVVTASEFRARFFSLLREIQEGGEPMDVTKRGQVVARLIPAREDEERPWLRLAGTVRWHDDAKVPAVREAEIDALK